MTIMQTAKFSKEEKSAWVSVAPDNKRIIARAKTPKELFAKLKKMGNPSGSITFIPSQKFSSYVG